MTETTPANLTILLVEDDEDTRYLMCLEFERRGYRVIEAADGEKAVTLAEQESPNIILMDLSLPRIDGMEATKQIREIEGMRTVPIIAVTAHQETDFRESAKASGFDAYVTKPMDFDWLNDLMVGLLA
jgi:two-component system, cell cycle response regulator DivK